MVLHNDKWKKKASKKYHNKRGTALGSDLNESSARKINISSEDNHHNSDELLSNRKVNNYVETIISDEDIWVDYTKVLAKEFTLPEPDIISNDELPKNRFGKGKLVYEDAENVYHLRRQVENELSLKEIKKKYNSRVKVRTVKGLCLDMEKSESDIEDIDELLKKTEFVEKQIDDNISQEKSIQMNTIIKDKELEDFLDKLLN
ncbi:hypothetical protein PNEG_02632 [Pneumocystis murina B123]|uniref:Uncharacterized protein n=1 Tax=Pneumocystis murina (strain B123) TaxID=1069680 RepID=M7P4U0_PNEMU|nr:hypothetical protein PNEG_02632 [Pneumocystis murina B123]EMR08845.1 hypothetical protein PNEG_02632 [Pneumocystis murina B123]